MKIYHNPRCQKSRQSLQLLLDNNVEPEIVLYLDDVPTQKEIKDILKKLGIKAEQLIRKGEKIFKEEFKGKELTEAQWVKAMTDNPKLIERPIVIAKNKAVIGRPPELVLSLI